MYINVGAYVDGVRPKTKKALREAVQNGARVEFDATSMFQDGQRFTVQHTIATSDVLTVCGPDPHSKRVWYATVKGGKVT